MSAATPKSPIFWTEEEQDGLSNRGLAIYEKLKPTLQPRYDRKFIAIHVETEDYEVDTYSGGAMRASRKRHPQGFLLMRKIGNEPEWGLAMRLLGLWGPARRSSCPSYKHKGDYTMSENTVLETSPNLLTQMTDEEHETLTNRGLAIYEEKLKPILEPAYDNQYVAIHVDTGDYEVAASTGDAMRAMRKRRTEGRLLMRRIGNEPEWGLAARIMAGRMATGQTK